MLWLLDTAVSLDWPKLGHRGFSPAHSSPFW